MSIKLKNIASIGNGGDGLRVGPGVKIEIENFVSARNGGYGANMHQNAEVSLTDFVAIENRSGGLQVTDFADELRAAGVTMTAESENLLKEAVRSASGASSRREAEDRLQRSGFGRWLREQRVVEWLTLITKIADKIPQG